MEPITLAVVLWALSRSRSVPVPRDSGVRVIPVAGHSLPTSGILSWGYQRTPTHRHNGIDLPAPEGTPVLASADGLVEVATDAWIPGFTGYGKVVVLKHNASGVMVWTLSAHLMRAAVELRKPGGRSPLQPVRAGDVIGYVGRTQYSAPEHTSLLPPGHSHVHFEVSPRAYPQASTAQRLDPVAWLRAEVAPMGQV